MFKQLHWCATSKCNDRLPGLNIRRWCNVRKAAKPTSTQDYKQVILRDPKLRAIYLRQLYLNTLLITLPSYPYPSPYPSPPLPSFPRCSHSSEKRTSIKYYMYAYTHELRLIRSTICRFVFK